MDVSSLMTLCFAAALVAGLLVKFWLATRQIRHVATPPRTAYPHHLPHHEPGSPPEGG